MATGSGLLVTALAALARDWHPVASTMEQPSDRRRYPRLSLEAGFTARFRAADKSFTAVQMSDLSAGGTCLRVDAQEADPLLKGTQVSTLYLDHPDLPTVPLQGQVSWLMGKVAGKTEGFVLVGVEFSGLNPKIEAALARFVDERLGLADDPCDP